MIAGWLLLAAAGWGEGSGTPLVEAGWLLHGGLLLVAALVGSLLVLHRLEQGPRGLSIRALRRETDRAIAECDDVSFFSVCRLAVQHRLAARWGCAPASITLNEMRARHVVAELQSFFEVADAVAYSGRVVFQGEMRRWQQIVLAGIERLEREA